MDALQDHEGDDENDDREFLKLEAEGEHLKAQLKALQEALKELGFYSLNIDSKYGSGTNTSIGANTISSYSGTAPQMYWIIDDSENGLSAYTAHPGSQSVRILPSCTGFAPY